MKPVDQSILTINGGSSSLKFALYETGDSLTRTRFGQIDRIGLSGTHLTVHNGKGPPQEIPIPGEAPDHKAVADFLIGWLEKETKFGSVRAVGHRVVHGMQHTEPEQVTKALLDELRSLIPYAPDHLPSEIQLIEAFKEQYPDLPQIACFDTAFHRNMPRVARLLPIPRRYEAKGVERYGFHGLSYTYLMEELCRLDPAANRSRVLLAHLGNGASLAAVRGGKSVDTSMGFTPASGLVMGTRTGDLDPGIVSFLMQSEQMTPPQYDAMVNRESGLLGISETSSDMRDLCAAEATDRRAAEAVELFCYQAKKWIGSFAAAMGGIDTLVFAGGIGENAPTVRARICAGLEFLGIELKEKRNAANKGVISTSSGAVTVRVIPTNEELMIARMTVP